MTSFEDRLARLISHAQAAVAWRSKFAAEPGVNARDETYAAGLVRGLEMAAQEYDRGDQDELIARGPAGPPGTFL